MECVVRYTGRIYATQTTIFFVWNH